MTNNTSTFIPSTQILETAEQAQALADAGKAFKHFFSPEIQETVDGVDKIANALNSTGEALRHFGFDEAEPEVTTSEVELVPTYDWQFVDNMNPTFGDLVPDSLRPSTYVIEGGQALQDNGLGGTGEAIETAGQVMRSFGFDEVEADELTGTGPGLYSGYGSLQPIPLGGPIIKPDPDAPKQSETLKEAGTVLGAGGAVLGSYGAPLSAFGGIMVVSGYIAGAFGLDEAEPYISEVGVDALA